MTYRYHSMTDLSGLASESFDLVYSGQSIEHVTQAEAESVLAQVRRVLRPGGILALDTPNSRLTRLQQAAFVDPDHKYQSRHKEMVALLEDSGFVDRAGAGHQLRRCVVARGVFDPTSWPPSAASTTPIEAVPVGLRLPPPRLTRRGLPSRGTVRSGLRRGSHETRSFGARGGPALLDVEAMRRDGAGARRRRRRGEQRQVERPWAIIDRVWATDGAGVVPV